jgi:Cof subfamily protein (haloacid dehalogenase superfamily)
MKPIRLLATDLDGTLLNSTWKLSDANRAALDESHRRGVHIAFVTGRRYQTTLPITQTFDFHHTVITTAGAVTRTHTGELLFSHHLERGLVHELLAHIEEFRPMTFLISDADGREDLHCERPRLENVHVGRYVQLNTPCMRQVSDLTRSINERLIEVVLMGHIGEMREALGRIDGFSRRSELKVLRTEYLDRDLCLLDVIAAQTDKGLAVRQLSEHFGVQRECVMAIGDNYSDLEMLDFAGCPVVMGNATEEVKSRGWHITATNDQDGVAEAIRRFILSRS